MSGTGSASPRRGANSPGWPARPADGFGVAVMEALACGLPVVAYDHPDNHARHLLADGRAGRLVPDLAPATVAGALRWALDEAGRGPAVASRTVHEYDWDAVARRMSRLYATP